MNHITWLTKKQSITNALPTAIDKQMQLKLMTKYSGSVAEWFGVSFFDDHNLKVGGSTAIQVSL